MSRNSSRSTSADRRIAVGQTVYLSEPLAQLGLPRGALGAVVVVFTQPRLRGGVRQRGRRDPRARHVEAEADLRDSANRRDMTGLVRWRSWGRNS